MDQNLTISTQVRSKNIRKEMQPITPSQVIGDEEQPSPGDLRTLRAYQAVLFQSLSQHNLKFK